MKAAQFVLENKKGEVVRTLSWPGQSLHVIYRHDTKRIETWADLEILKNEKITFDIIKTIKKSDLKKETSVSIEKVGCIRCVESFENTTPSVVHSEDDTKPLFISLKWISGFAAGLLLVLFGVSFFFDSNKEVELKTVQIIDVEKTVEPVEKIKISKEEVVPTEKKIKKQAMSKTIAPRKAPKITSNKKTINQMGALGVLGSLNKSNQKGGLDLGSVETSRGIGRGGNQGSGGMQTTVYGKGLLSAPLGSGQRADGAGGYGTKGKGGGQAGYGKISLVGSGGSFFQPVNSETLVEGGLDRNEIAAVIERHLGEIRYCYEQGLQQNPDMSGRVSMGFTIGSDGFVKTTKISNSSLRSKQVEGCIENRLKSWKFPKPRGGVNVKVNYPFVLKRVSEA